MKRQYISRRLNESEREQYAAIRTRAAAKVPYLAAALFQLRPFVAEGLGTYAADGKGRIFLDLEGRPGEWYIGQRTGALIRALLYVLRNHCSREVQFRVHTACDPRVWQLASALEINDDVAKLPGVVLPEELVINPEDVDLPGAALVEFYAREIPAPDDDGVIRIGSGDGAEVKDFAGPGVDLMGESEEGARSSMELDALRKTVAQAVQEYLKGPRGRGDDVPAGMRLWAEVMLAPPKVDWRQQLRSAVRGTIETWKSRSHYTFRKVSRRAANTEALPGRTGRLPNVVMGIDTSGSMGRKDFEWTLSEVDGICRRAGITGKAFRVFCVDARVSECQTVQDALKVELTGGGGTDMRLAFEYVDQLPRVQRPSVFVLATDGDTPWPGEPLQGIDVIVLLTTGEFEGRVPKWIRNVIRIDEDANGS